MANLKDSLDMIGTTLNAWMKDAPNAIINSNGALYFFKTFGKMKLKGKNDEKMGSIETLDGGTQIDIDIQMTANPNIGFVAYDEAVPITEQDSMATATYDWKYCYGNAPISKAKIDANSSDKFSKRNLVQTIINVAETSMINAIGAGLWNTADADSLVGFSQLITDDGTTTTVGGLSTVTYPNWANQFENLAAVHTFEELKASLSTLYRECKTGADAPDLILMGSDLYGEFESGLTAQERYTKGSKADMIANAGFEQLKFKGATIIEDQNCPANRAYVINTKSCGFYFHSSDMLTVADREKKYGGMQYNYPISSTCALVAKNRRDLGVLVIAAS